MPNDSAVVDRVRFTGLQSYYDPDWSVQLLEKIVPEPEKKEKYVREEVLAYRDLYNNVLHTGSSVIVRKEDQEGKDGVKPKDDDWVLLIPEISQSEFTGRLIRDGFLVGGSFDPGIPSIYTRDEVSGFTSYRKDDLNLIVTSNPTFFYDFENATKLCKFLNLKEKKDRVAVFRAIRDGIWPEVDL